MRPKRSGIPASGRLWLISLLVWNGTLYADKPASSGFVSSRRPPASIPRLASLPSVSPAQGTLSQPPPETLPAAPWEPYWSQLIREPIESNQAPLPVSQDLLVLRALEHSAQIRVYADGPLIRETAIDEAQANFDWKSFLDTRWNDLNEPVGSTLTTGHSGRYNNHQWTANGGVRRQNEYGGKAEIAQQFGFQNTNSNFFVPQDQGTSRLTLSYTQPLLKGSGRCYNTRVVVLAELDAAVAEDELLRQLDGHLFEIIRGYWSLYLERGNVAQKRKQLDRACRWLAELERREELDAVQSQILQGRAVVAAREAELFRIENAIQNAEARIRALVNSPDMLEPQLQEFVPTDIAVIAPIPLDPVLARELATQNRVEIRQAIKQVKASSERLSMSRNEVLPALDLVLQTYTAGLRGNSNIPNAWTDQFSTGAPSYTAGLVFEVPLGNRAAHARLTRRQLELRQITSQMQVALETLMLEVDVAVREVETSHRELDARLRATQAAEAEIQYLENRWRHMAGDGVSGASLLHDLFQALDRFSAAEYGQLQALVTYNLALINIKKATGTLLQEQRVVMGRGCEDGLPILIPDQVPYPIARSRSQQPAESDGEVVVMGPTAEPVVHGPPVAAPRSPPAVRTVATPAKQPTFIPPSAPAAPAGTEPATTVPTPTVSAPTVPTPTRPVSTVKPAPRTSKVITEQDLTAPVVVEEDVGPITTQPLPPPSSTTSSRRRSPRVASTPPSRTASQR